MEITREESDVQLSILQWNCRAINTNLPFLQNFLTKQLPDVLCIQSLKCKASNLPHLDGYYPPVYKTARENRESVPVATYVKLTVQFHTVTLDIPNDEDHPIHSVAIAVRSGNEHTNILNLYAPKSVNRDNVKWIEDLFQEGSSWLVLGDFNAHHPLWYKENCFPTRINEQLAEYRKELIKKYGNTFFASILISMLVAKRKSELKYQNLHEVSKHY